MIPSVIREYLHKRTRSQPLDKSTCGCVFKNFSKNCRAGKFLDILGLKGFTYNGITISPVHANFMENSGMGSSTDFLKMVDIINEEVYLQFGIRFELEVKL